MNALDEPTAAAREVLDRCWNGRFTSSVPGPPHRQRSWDAALVARSLARRDPDRAEAELRHLFAAQWDNGLLPHLVFDPGDPGADVWDVGCSRHAPADAATSGIVHPPLHASAALHVYRCAAERDRARRLLEDLWPALVAWHRYLYRDRDPDGTGLAALRHPWESPDRCPLIQDAAPDGDELRAVEVFRRHDYDESLIRRHAPFLLRGVLFNAVLVRANRDLAEIAAVLGFGPHPFEAWAQHTADAMNRLLWDEEAGAYTDVDERSGERAVPTTAGAAAALFAAVPDRTRAEGLARLVERSADLGVGDAQLRVTTARLLGLGLQQYGFGDLAAGVRKDVLDTVRERGMVPCLGVGEAGGPPSAATAAVVLDWLEEPAD